MILTQYQLTCSLQQKVPHQCPCLNHIDTKVTSVNLSQLNQVETLVTSVSPSQLHDHPLWTDQSEKELVGHVF